MVSRGGRSRGCSNCRRRRVKCDEARPTCNRCQKLGLVCDGPKEQTWINQYAVSVLPSSSATPEIPSILESPTSLSLVAFKDEICLAYTRKTLLRGGPVDVALEMIHPDGLVSSQDPGISLLRDAILSLAVTFFGSQHQQATITRQGYQQYGTVLGRLNTHLMRPGLQARDETILTVLTCMLLEIFLPTGPNNFLKHLLGIEAILELRGPPSMPMSDTGRALFMGLRILSITGGLVMSRPSLYSRPEWKAIDVVHKDAASEMRYRLYTVLADCTQLMASRDAVLCSPSSQDKLILIDQTHSLYNELELIYQDWLRDDQKQSGEHSCSNADGAPFADYTSTTAHMLYNLARICLVDILDAVDPLPWSDAIRHDAAFEIIKNLEFKVNQQRLGAPESNTIGFVATKVSWQALGGFNTPEGRELASVVKEAVNNIFDISTWENEPTIPHRAGLPFSPNRESQTKIWKDCHHEQHSETWMGDVTATRKIQLTGAGGPCL